MQQAEFKNIVISGASSGIGAELAIQLAGAGAHLCLLGRDGKRLLEIAQKCQANGAETSTHIIDVRNDQEMKDLINGVLRGSSGGSGSTDDDDDMSM